MLTAIGVSKRYGSTLALDGFTVDIEPGIIGFVGANGAGKSTFLRILLGLTTPTAGRVALFGHDVVKQTMDVRAFVGYLPEHDCLPPEVSGTDFVTHIGQMSGLPFAAARERAAETLRHVGLHEERYRLIGSYSTGMKQRVKLAQALVHDPRLLLLDEPTNGLDPEGRDEMLELVRRTGREFGISVIVTSHLLGEIERVCDYLVAIEGGKLSYAGPVAGLTAQTERLRIELDDDAEPLAAKLRHAGVEVESHGDTLYVPVHGDAIYDIIRDAAAELNAPLARMEVTRKRLDDLFRGAEAGPRG